MYVCAYVFLSVISTKHQNIALFALSSLWLGVFSFNSDFIMLSFPHCYCAHFFVALALIFCLLVVYNGKLKSLTQWLNNNNRNCVLFHIFFLIFLLFLIYFDISSVSHCVLFFWIALLLFSQCFSVQCICMYVQLHIIFFFNFVLNFYKVFPISVLQFFLFLKKKFMM